MCLYEVWRDFMEKMDGQLYLVSKLAEKVYSEEDFFQGGGNIILCLVVRLPERIHADKALTFYMFP